MSDNKKPDFSTDSPDFSQKITEKKDVLCNSDLPTLRPLKPSDKDELLKKLKKNKKD